MSGVKEQPQASLPLRPARQPLRSVRRLVTQDKDLEVLGGVTAAELGEELDGAAKGQVGESWQHLGAASATG
jgi:hypothetical protein